jgi:FkbM family methyltransferase
MLNTDKHAANRNIRMLSPTPLNATSSVPLSSTHDGRDPQPYGAYEPKGILRALLAFTQAMPTSWIGKRLAFIARRLGLMVLKGQSADVERFGAKFRLHPYQNVCEKRVLFTPQLFDGNERKILERKILEAKTAQNTTEGFRFIDVGANIGAYALFVAALAGPRAKILAVEPQPDIFDRLVANIAFNPFGTVKAIACAISNKAGELTLFLDPRNKGESSIKIIGSSQAQSIRVPALTLRDVMTQEGLSGLDAIKLDVEGAEDLILEPFLHDAPEALWPKLIILEDGSGRWQMDLNQLLTQKGYTLLMRTRLNYVYERS